VPDNEDPDKCQYPTVDLLRQFTPISEIQLHTFFVLDNFIGMIWLDLMRSFDEEGSDSFIVDIGKSIRTHISDAGDGRVWISTFDCGVNGSHQLRGDFSLLARVVSGGLQIEQSFSATQLPLMKSQYVEMSLTPVALRPAEDGFFNWNSILPQLGNLRDHLRRLYQKAIDEDAFV
jgi:hypothetical protein